jgi:adenylosuccinate lyase
MTYFSKYFIGLAVIWLGLFGMIGHCTAAPDENWHKKSDQVKTEAANKKMEIKTVDLTQVKSRELIIKLKHHHEDFAAMLSDIGAELMDTPPR